jgi:hypothetical protein
VYRLSNSKAGHVCAVYLDNQLIVQDTGNTSRLAKQRAAALALVHLEKRLSEQRK